MANLEGMPIGSLPELTGDLQDEDEVVVYRPSTGKAYQANTDLIDSYGEVFSLDSGESIPENADLNDYNTAGNYIVASNTIAASLSNSPTATAFMLKVLYPTGANAYAVQIAISYMGTAIYFRGYTRSSATWRDWRSITTTTIS